VVDHAFKRLGHVCQEEAVLEQMMLPRWHGGLGMFSSR
jgi:hypothetical protein